MSKKLPVLDGHDREHLKNIGFGNLPDNPSQAKYSAKEIKGASTRPNLQLFDWIKETREYLESDGKLHMAESEEDALGYPVGSIVLLMQDGKLQPFVVGEDGLIELLMESTTKLYNVTNLTGVEYELDDGTSSQSEAKTMSIISDVKVNGLSIADRNGVVELSLSGGIGANGSSLSLTTDRLQEVVPKTLGVGEQEGIRLFAEKNGVPSYVSAANLDYSKLSVMDSENLNEVRMNDFLFLKEN